MEATRAYRNYSCSTRTPRYGHASATEYAHLIESDLITVSLCVGIHAPQHVGVHRAIFLTDVML